jgi:ABC-type multidrug transport system fused ATPase/permease subunit
MNDPASAALEDPLPHPPAVAVDETHVPHEQPVSLPALYRALWHHAADARYLILGAFLLLLGSQLFKLGVPWMAGNAINAIQAGGLGSLPAAARWLALVFAAIVASWLLHGPGRILERNVALKVRERLSAR